MMLRLNLLLLLALLASALSLVHQQYEARRLFVALERANAAADRLASEHEQLQVQKRTLAAPARVASTGLWPPIASMKLPPITAAGLTAYHSPISPSVSASQTGTPACGVSPSERRTKARPWARTASPASSARAGWRGDAIRPLGRAAAPA